MSTEPTPTPPPSVRAVIIQALGEALESNRDLIRFADDFGRAELESERRDLSAALDWAESPTPPDLSAVPIDDLSREIARREIAGECVALIVTPSDLAEFWECDDAGATHPGSEEPNREEMRAIRKAFEVWQDVGGFSEIMNACRDAWNDAKAKGKGESK
jgi:hypothetical protein